MTIIRGMTLDPWDEHRWPTARTISRKPMPPQCIGLWPRISAESGWNLQTLREINEDNGKLLLWSQFFFWTVRKTIEMNICSLFTMQCLTPMDGNVWLRKASIEPTVMRWNSWSKKKWMVFQTKNDPFDSILEHGISIDVGTELASS